MTEKIGALGDFVDIACGIAISGNAGKNLNNAITSFMKSSGKYLSKTDFLKLQKYLQMTHKVNAAKIVEKLEQKYGISISTNMLGRIANEHHLKTAEYGYLAYDKAKSSIKQVESFRYYENAVDKFYEIISNDQKLKERYLK